jgi:hypothetical protein
MRFLICLLKGNKDNCKALLFIILNGGGCNYSPAVEEIHKVQNRGYNRWKCPDSCKIGEY